MATYNQLRTGTNSQKKGVCVAATKLDFTEQNVASAETVLVANLPANAVVVNAYFYVGTGLSNVTATGKITVGSTDVIPAVAFAGVDDVVKGGVVTRVSTGETGAEMVITIGTASATDGEVTAVVEYIEHTKVTGELTQID